MERAIQAKMKRKEEEKRKHVFGRNENTFSSFKKRVLEPLENAFSFSSPSARSLPNKTNSVLPQNADAFAPKRTAFFVAYTNSLDSERIILILAKLYKNFCTSEKFPYLCRNY
jgi:hypothetical protein